VRPAGVRGTPHAWPARIQVAGTVPTTSAGCPDTTTRPPGTAVLATFGVAFAAGAAWLGFAAGLPVLGWVMVVIAVIALADLGVVLYRKRRGEPG
jgi:hypothetical protein